MSVPAHTVKHRSLDPPSRPGAVPGTQVRPITFRERGSLTAGKLGLYMGWHALDRGYEVAGVCREQSVAKLDAFKGSMIVMPGATDDREVIRNAVAGCDGVLTVLVPRGVHGYSTGTAQAVLDYAPRLVHWRVGRSSEQSCSTHTTGRCAS